jgi:microtubule-associated protein-like 6
LDLKSAARAVAYSPDGTKIAVGFGGGGRGYKKDGKEGSFRIYSENSLELLLEQRDSKQYIGDIRFSPDGKTLAVASHDNSVYLYDVLAHFKRKAKVNKHNSYVRERTRKADSPPLQPNPPPPPSQLHHAHRFLPRLEIHAE